VDKFKRLRMKMIINIYLPILYILGIFCNTFFILNHLNEYKTFLFSMAIMGIFFGILGLIKLF